MATLRDIFAEAEDAAVTAAIGHIYECEKEWLPVAIANTLAELRRLALDASGGAHELHIERTDPLLKGDEPGWEVWVSRKDDPERYGLSLSPWEEWLAVEVPEPLRATMPAAEIAAHCIWDMTFHGWTQEQIAKERAELDRRIREIDEGKVEMIPWEDVKERLREKFPSLKSHEESATDGEHDSTSDQ
jgi:putative addiction module component (TIGR02574 family)